MVGTGFAVAAVCYFASNTVLATSDGLTVPSLTLNQAFQTFNSLMDATHENKTLLSLTRTMKPLDLQHLVDNIRKYGKKVSAAIALQCKIFTNYKTIVNLNHEDLTDEDILVTLKDAVNDMHARMATLKDFPSFLSGDQFKNKLIGMNMANNKEEFAYDASSENVYLCYNALMEGTQDLKSLKRQFDDYLSERAKKFARPAEEGAAPSSPPTETNSGSETSDDSQPGTANGNENVPAASTTPPPTAGTETSVSPSAPADQPTAPTPAGVPVPPSPEASSASTSAPAAGEQAGPTEQQPQDATSSASAPATGESAAPIAASTTPSSPAATGATGETAQQEGTPQVENLKPAPTGSSASFNGLAVAVLSVLVVSSM